MSFEPGDERPVQVFFQDEARFGRINVPCRCWAPKGVRPHVPKQIVRQYIYAYSAVIPATGEIFSLLASHCDCQVMSIFINELSEEYQAYRNIIVMDKAAWHTTNELHAFDNVRYIFLPPYSPELNPAEHLWKDVRDMKFRNTIYGSLDGIEDALCDYFDSADRKRNYIKSMTLFEWLKPYV